MPGSNDASVTLTGPELVTREDIVEFNLQADPVSDGPRALYLERITHAAILEARPQITSNCARDHIQSYQTQVRSSLLVESVD